MMNKLEDWFFNKEHDHICHKWHHYFEVYHRYFEKFIGQNPTILEIGVFRGGSLEMWNDYFDGECTIYGIDMDPSCADIEVPNSEIIIGDQSSASFWEMFKERGIEFDIIIDDGGHHMNQQITTLEQMYPEVQEGGFYLVEDTHTSYWKEYSGGLRAEGTFMEFAKHLVDAMNSCHFKQPYTADEMSLKKRFDWIRSQTKGLYFHDSIVVLEKGVNKSPTHSQR